MTGPQYEPIPVHVVSAPAVKPEEITAVYLTVELQLVDTDTVASSLLLPASTKRVGAYVQALDDDVIISGNESDARKGAGTVVPHTNTTPWPINDHGVVYVACRQLGGAKSRVSLCAWYRV